MTILSINQTLKNAVKWKDKINKKVYDALYNWET